MGAKAIKTLKDKPITGNYCCGGEYNEDETLQEVRFLREYFKVLPKDVKYYMGKDYTINPVFDKILDEYEDFLRVNQGFIKVEKTDDVIIPESVKPLNDVQKVFDKIEEVTENGKLPELVDLLI